MRASQHLWAGAHTGQEQLSGAEQNSAWKTANLRTTAKNEVIFLRVARATFVVFLSGPVRSGPVCLSAGFILHTDTASSSSSSSSSSPPSFSSSSLYLHRCLTLQTVKLSTTLTVAFPLLSFKIKSQRNTLRWCVFDLILHMSKSN